MVTTHFKGWAKPGIVPPGASGSPEVPADETLDAISGHFRLFQLKHGHRFSTDDLLAAWYGTTWVPSVRRVLELGAGVGTVGMIAAWRLAGASFVTIEAQDESVRLARKSAAYNGVESRFDVRAGDFRDPQILAGDAPFDLVLGSPPYFPIGTGLPGDHPQKVACRFELRGDVGDYARVASKHMAAGGLFACVFPDVQHARIAVAASAAELSIVRRRPVILREGDAPLISLFAMMRSNDLPEPGRTRTWVEPPLIVRTSGGAVHPEYAALKLSLGFPP